LPHSRMLDGSIVNCLLLILENKEQRSKIHHSDKGEKIMLKKKVAFAVLMATLVVLVVPLTVTPKDAIPMSLDEIYTCADAVIGPEVCYSGTDRYCEGDTMTSVPCQVTCHSSYVISIVNCSAPAALPVHKD